VRAGIAMSSLGVPSIQHLVSIDDNVRRLLPPTIRWISSATEDTLDPHLIIQFHAGTRVVAGDIDITSPAPNRLIVANDLPNREMRLSEELAGELRGADVFVVSGFNTMQDASLLETRLADLRTAMVGLPRHALVYYEEAGFYEPAFRERVRLALADLIDVYSMNEDELQEELGREVDLLDARAVADAVTELRARVPVPALVVHSRHWALAAGPTAALYRTALRGAVDMAATRYRVGDGHTAADYATTAELTPRPDAALFALAIEHTLEGAVCVPGYGFDVPRPTTIGLGDAFVGGFVAAWSLAVV